MYKQILLLSAVIALSQCHTLAESVIEGRALRYPQHYSGYRAPPTEKELEEQKKKQDKELKEKQKELDAEKAKFEKEKEKFEKKKKDEDKKKKDADKNKGGSRWENQVQEKLKKKGQAISRLSHAAVKTAIEEKNTIVQAAKSTAAAGYNIAKSKFDLLFFLPKVAINALSEPDSETESYF